MARLEHPIRRHVVQVLHLVALLIRRCDLDPIEKLACHVAAIHLGLA